MTAMMDKPRTVRSFDDKLSRDLVSEPKRQSLRRSKTAELIRILLIVFVLLVVVRLVFWFVAGR
jgi:hypothetical protein